MLNFLWMRGGSGAESTLASSLDQLSCSSAPNHPVNPRGRGGPTTTLSSDFVMGAAPSARHGSSFNSKPKPDFRPARRSLAFEAVSSLPLNLRDEEVKSEHGHPTSSAPTYTAPTYSAPTYSAPSSYAKPAYTPPPPVPEQPLWSQFNSGFSSFSKPAPQSNPQPAKPEPEPSRYEQPRYEEAKEEKAAVSSPQLVTIVYGKPEKAKYGQKPVAQSPPEHMTSQSTPQQQSQPQPQTASYQQAPERQEAPASSYYQPPAPQPPAYYQQSVPVQLAKTTRSPRHSMSDADATAPRPPQPFRAPRRSAAFAEKTMQDRDRERCARLSMDRRRRVQVDLQGEEISRALSSDEDLTPRVVKSNYVPKCLL